MQTQLGSGSELVKGPQSLVIIDIDGLRRDVFLKALDAGEVPNITRIVGGREATRACHVDAVSTAPSITFTAQASIVTGEHPRDAWYPRQRELRPLRPYLERASAPLRLRRGRHAGGG